MSWIINHICEMCKTHNSVEFTYCQNCHCDLIQITERLPESHADAFNQQKNNIWITGFIPLF